MTLCRHCRERHAGRPRGLCSPCYYNPGVRDLYPLVSKFARRGVLDGNGPRQQAEPTQAARGTPEKVDVLAQRAAAGLALFHEDDA